MFQTVLRSLSAVLHCGKSEESGREAASTTNQTQGRTASHMNPLYDHNPIVSGAWPNKDRCATYTPRDVKDQMADMVTEQEEDHVDDIEEEDQGFNAASTSNAEEDNVIDELWTSNATLTSNSRHMPLGSPAETPLPSSLPDSYDPDGTPCPPPRPRKRQKTTQSSSQFQIPSTVQARSAGGSCPSGPRRGKMKEKNSEFDEYGSTVTWTMRSLFYAV